MQVDMKEMRKIPSHIVNTPIFWHLYLLAEFYFPCVKAKITSFGVYMTEITSPIASVVYLLIAIVVEPKE